MGYPLRFLHYYWANRIKLKQIHVRGPFVRIPVAAVPNVLERRVSRPCDTQIVWGCPASRLPAQTRKATDAAEQHRLQMETFALIWSVSGEVCRSAAQRWLTHISTSNRIEGKHRDPTISNCHSISLFQLLRHFLDYQWSLPSNKSEQRIKISHSSSARA